jgi:hypothetical protein
MLGLVVLVGLLAVVIFSAQMRAISLRSARYRYIVCRNCDTRIGAQTGGINHQSELVKG